MKVNSKPLLQSELNNIRNIYYPVKNDNYGRVGHRIIAVLHNILIFGGVNAHNEYNPTTMRLDCQTMLIEPIPTKNALKLQGFSLFAYNQSIYIWGGSGPYQENPKSSICTNNMLKFTGDSFIAVQQKGKIPAARQYHASCFFKGRYLIIMGGNNGKQFLNDWHILDCSSMEWTPIRVNPELPFSLNPLIFWKGGRGFLLTGQLFVRQSRQVVRDNKVYTFRFSDFKNRTLQLELLSIGSETKQRNPRGSPVGVIAGLQSPYIILVGGQIYKEGTVVKFCDTIDCLNVQTLEWHSIELTPQAACSFQALYQNQKIYLVGGIANNRQINQYVEFIELKVDYIEARVCKVCRELYGMKELPQDKNMNIKFEAQLAPRTFFNCEIISRMAAYINYPFSALGLLIDNSLNLSATNIEIVFGLEGIPKTDSREIRSFQNEENFVPYDYIVIYDNSFGFSQNQILECLCSFTVKTQKFTSDKRYQQQIEIKKEYGINLKLGALRLGQSCLYITRTEENSRLIAYFSCAGEASKQQFTVFSYFINADGSCSSEVNRRIIYHNVKQKLPINYENSKTTTTIYIFDITKKQMIVTEQQGNPVVSHQQSPNKIFRYLQDYLQSLYLVPFTGRKISINKKEIKCRNYCQIFRKDEMAGKISRVTDDYPKELLNTFNVYRILDQKYFLRNILFYHKNRLIFVMNRQDRYCGVVELSELISVDICKTKIQNRSDQVTFIKVIKSILNKHQEKRIAPPIVLANPTKFKDNVAVETKDQKERSRKGQNRK